MRRPLPPREPDTNGALSHRTGTLVPTFARVWRQCVDATLGRAGDQPGVLPAMTDKRNGCRNWLDTRDAYRTLGVGEHSLLQTAVRYGIERRKGRTANGKAGWFYDADAVEQVARGEREPVQEIERGGLVQYRTGIHRRGRDRRTECGLIVPLVEPVDGIESQLCRICFPTPKRERTDKRPLDEIPWWEYDRRRRL